MKVPLRVDAVERNGREYLDIWYGDNKHKCIKSPVNPYFYSKNPLTFTGSIRSEVKAKALSDLRLRTFYKHSFKTREELVEARSDETFEDNIPFVLRNRLDDPEFFYRFPQKQLRFLFFDIEQKASNGIFPTYDDPITSIAWATNDRKVRCIKMKKTSKDDRNLTSLFIDHYQKIDPHILVVYNKEYDIATLLQRCKKHKIPTSSLAKTNKEAYIGGKEHFHIEGIVIYDVAQSAFADQSLSGDVENRGLKEVSNFYGYKEERKPLTPEQMNQLIGTDELARYNMDDVERLMLLFDVYWPNIEFNANDLGIPLNESVELNITNLGIITVGDEYKRLNIIADGSNEQRFPNIFRRNKAKDEKNYEGALVFIENPGFFKPVYKVDFSSLYPTIMAEFNFSPDSTTLIKLDTYAPELEVEEHEDSYIYAIPDASINKRLIIKVSKQQGFASALIHRYLSERSVYKKRYRETKNPIDKATSDNRKVKANGGVYGIMGSAKHSYGYAPSAIATTAIGREVMMMLVDIIKTHHGPKSVIEVDTDGCYYSCDPLSFNNDLIRTELANQIKERFHSNIALSIDFDIYKAGWFYKAKNYALLTENNKIILHGASMKASNKNRLSKNLISELAKAKLHAQPVDDIKKKYQSLDFPLLWFAMNIKMGKRLNSYKSDNALSKRLAVEAQDKLGIEPKIGNIYHYVKTNAGYTLFQLAKKSDIDRSYYLQQVATIIEMFDEQPRQETIEEWI